MSRNWGIGLACLTVFIALASTAEEKKEENKKPQDLVKISGGKIIEATKKKLVVKQTSKSAVITFVGDIDPLKLEKIEIDKPEGAMTLFRVNNGNPSQIHGHLKNVSEKLLKDGVLMVINPNGIIVGPAGQIDISKQTPKIESTLERR